MENQFKLKVNDSYEFEFSDSDLAQLDWVKTGSKTYHLIDESQSYHVSFDRNDVDAKTYEVTINNTRYGVSIENPLDLLISALGFELDSATKVGSIEAPMPGLILEVSVAEGDEVKEGDTLLILEAMKMENVISSPRDGVIKSVEIKKGDAVEKKHLLITFE